MTPRQEQLIDAAVRFAPWAAPLIGGGLWRWWQRRRAHRAREAELLEAMAEQCRASADFDRFQIRFLIGRDYEALLPYQALDQYEGVKARVRETRQRLWLARGYPESSPLEELTDSERAILSEGRQAHRWRMRERAEKTKPRDTEGDSQ